MQYEIYSGDDEYINTCSLHEDDVNVGDIIKTFHWADADCTLFYFTIFKIEDNRIFVE